MNSLLDTNPICMNVDVTKFIISCQLNIDILLVKTENANFSEVNNFKFLCMHLARDLALKYRVDYISTKFNKSAGFLYKLCIIH